MSFKKLTATQLIDNIKDGKLHELKTTIDSEIVEKITNRVVAKKKEYIKGIAERKM